MRQIIASLALTALIACGGDDTRQGEPAAKLPGPEATATGTAAADGAVTPALPAPSTQRNILFLGTSLTAGLGVGADAAFPAVIQSRIDSAQLPFHVLNAGISGETSAGGLRRIDWLLQSPVDVLVLELGANDGLRGLNVDSLRSNLDGVLKRTRERYPDAAIVIAGMEAPPNLGTSYTSRFHAVYPALAKKYDAALVPFLLAGVAGQRALNQDDGMHPTVAGHRVVADNVWSVLRPVLVSRAKTPG
jgi:acyl-CoA thioesterase-1